jgi:peptidoglycan/LPS O-acetylase OafA/YrhL
LLIICAVYAVVTAPILFLPNPDDWSLMPLRLAQPIAAIAAFAASIIFLWGTRRSNLTVGRWLAIGVAVASVLWIALLFYLVSALDGSGMELMQAPTAVTITA